MASEELADFLLLPLVFSPGPQPMGRCHSCSEWVLPPELYVQKSVFWMFLNQVKLARKTTHCAVCLGLCFSVSADFHTVWVPITLPVALPFLLQCDDIAQLGSAFSSWLWSWSGCSLVLHSRGTPDITDLAWRTILQRSRQEAHRHHSC